MAAKKIEFELCPGRNIGTDHPCFIIAEIGQNHQGDVGIAKQMIKAAKEAGADCVKFQKSTVLERFNKKCLERPYNVPQSWGKTYGEHKLYLELSEDAYLELQAYAKELGIYFSASAFDFNAVNFLEKINVPFFKVPSSDTGSLEFIEFMAKKRVPMVISTGMQDMITVKRVYHLVKKYHDNFTFLQCTSAYPVGPENTNLRVIQTFQDTFKDVPIGYSGHESGISVSLAAVALGAKVLERHVTLDKSWKGTDHKASLDMSELTELVKQVRIVEASLGCPEKKMLDVEAPMKRKLGKSAVAIGDLKQGTVLSKDNMSIKNAEPVGFLPHEFSKLKGAILTKDVGDDETILPNAVEFSAETSAATGKFVAVVLARKGSKGVPGKNTKILNGLPLVAWSILAARKASCFDEIWVSTDCDHIGAIAESFGAMYFRRDPMSALDRSSSKDALLDFVGNHPDVWAAAYIQCTFPTQNPDLLSKAVSMIRADEFDCVFSVGRSHKFRWTPITAENKYTRPLNFDPSKRPRRQDWQGEIIENGAFYMFRVEELLCSGDYQSNRVTYLEDFGVGQGETVDIDTPEDFVRAELLVKKHCETYNLDDLIAPATGEKYRQMMMMEAARTAAAQKVGDTPQ